MAVCSTGLSESATCAQPGLAALGSVLAMLAESDGQPRPAGRGLSYPSRGARGSAAVAPALAAAPQWMLPQEVLWLMAVCSTEVSEPANCVSAPIRRGPALAGPGALTH
jgi:hypothetical protein